MDLRAGCDGGLAGPAPPEPPSGPAEAGTAPCRPTGALQSGRDPAAGKTLACGGVPKMEGAAAGLAQAFGQVPMLVLSCSSMPLRLNDPGDWPGG
jgi:hypothetical protein